MKKTLTILLAVVMCSLAAAQTKLVSVLGDSYSTYEGYMTPSTNELWYYAKNGEKKTDVTNVRQTWWHQVISENGWRLCVNNSYSGATVSYTGYDGNDYSARSFNTRMTELGQPDIIFVFGATNDSWAKTPIGEYKYDDITYGDLYQFRPAMAYLLQRMKDRYVNTEIYFLLNNDLRDEIDESVKTVCAHYGVPVIELEAIDKLSGHPSVKGMRQIADQVNAFLAGGKAGAVNDNNTPLHLMKPDYRLGYGVSKTDDVKTVMDRVLRYIETETPAELVDRKTGAPVTDLKKINTDIYAWLHIDGTNIDFPVLQHGESDAYYFNHDSDGHSSANGAVFSESYYNARDFITDPVVILYGHHMQSGAIFGHLQEYYTDPDFFASDTPVIVYTPEAEYEYRVFAAVPYSNEHILYFNDFTEDDVLDAFIDQIFATDSSKASFAEQYRPESGDHVLILSTCLESNNQNRFLVLATMQR